MLIALISLGFLVLVCLIFVPKLQVRYLKPFLKPGQLFDRENEVRKTLAQIIGGLAFVATIYGTVQTQRAANEQLSIASQQLAITREAQLSDRFTKAAEELSNKDPLVRIAGILSLEKAAHTDPDRYHWTMVEILTEFVRKAATLPTTKFSCPANSEGPLKDVYMALRVLGRRDAAKDPVDRRQNRLFLAGLDLCGAYLSRLDLEYVEFEGSYLERASLRESKLSYAWLSDAYLAHAFFQGANLTGASLEEADLTGAYFPKALLKNADLRDADLTDTCLDAADLSEAVNLTQQQLDAAIGDEQTRFPSTLTRPARWSVKHRPCTFE